MRKHRYVIPAAAVVLSLILAGCSGAEEGPSYEDSPLGKYLSAVSGGDLSADEQQKKYEEQQKEQEKIVAECMTAEGFEYTPRDADYGVVYSSSDDGIDYSSREFAEQWGYGMVHYPDEDSDSEPVEVEPDANDEYVNGLSESEQAAYYETLYGPGPDEEDMNEDGSYEYDWETAGCQGQADHEISKNNPLTSDEFEPIMDQINELYSTFSDSPEMAELNNKWVSCLADAGQSGPKSPSEASQSISDRMNALYEEHGDDQNWSPDDDPEFQKIGEDEIALAVADWDCKDKLNFEAESLKVQFALEEKFISEHKSELDALKAAAEQAQ